MSSRRSPLARARGLGSAGTGTELWFTQRMSWLATIILSALVLIQLLLLVGSSYGDVLAYFAGFWPTVTLTLFVAVTFFHYALELQEVIEDYVHARLLNLALLLSIRFGFVVLALAAILMILRNFFGA